jgi:hypothetical protein
VNNDEVLQRVKEERNVVQTIKRRKINLIGDMFCWNWLLKHVIEGMLEGRVEVNGRRKWRHKQLQDDLKVKTGYWKLKEEALDRTLWRNAFREDMEL